MSNKLMGLARHCGLLLALGVSGCGGGGGSGGGTDPTFTIGGSVSGLSGTVVLQNNGGDDLSITSDGIFTFAKSVQGSFAVSILHQPTTQTCIVASGSGTASSNVSGVAVSCTTNTYTVGGSVSGLVRPITLQIDGAETRSVLQNGEFQFNTPLNSGASYSVSVAAQAPAQSCTVTSGAGSSLSDVTNVSVVCVADLSARFLPVVSSPSVDVRGGKSGLLVVASNDVSTQPFWISSSDVRVFGFALPYEVDSSGKISGGLGTTLFFQTSDDSHDGHIWALDLTGASSLKPRQLSSQKLDPTCQYFGKVIQKDLMDPASAFLLLDVPDTTPCIWGSSSGRHVILVRLTDTETTPAVSLPAVPFYFFDIWPFYSPDGVLAGIAAIDANHNLNLYTDESFASSTTLLTGINGFASRRIDQVSPISTLMTDPTSNFFTVSSTTGGQSLYRIDHSGTVSGPLYDFNSENLSLAQDDDYLYFRDVQSLSSMTGSWADHVLRVPLDGSAPATLLYTYVNSSIGSPSVSLIGSNGSTLLLQRAGVIDPMTSQPASTVEAISLAAPSTPTILASKPGYGYPVQLFDDHIYITVDQVDPSAPVFSLIYASEILNLDGTVAQPLRSHSAFLFDGLSMFQISGITRGGYAGGTLLRLVDDPNSSHPWVQVLNTSGSAYNLPSGGQYDVLAWLAAHTSSLSLGDALTYGGRPGLIFDSQSNVIRDVAVQNSDLRFPSSVWFNYMFGDGV